MRIAYNTRLMTAELKYFLRSFILIAVVFFKCIFLPQIAFSTEEVDPLQPDECRVYLAKRILLNKEKIINDWRNAARPETVAKSIDPLKLDAISDLFDSTLGEVLEREFHNLNPRRVDLHKVYLDTGTVFSVVYECKLLRDLTLKTLESSEPGLSLLEQKTVVEILDAVLFKAAEELSRIEQQSREREKLAAQIQLNFVAIAHDLRTPLSAIGMALTILGRKLVEDPETQLYYARMIQMVRRADAMVSDFFDIIRIYQGEKISLNVEAASLVKIIRSAIENLATIYGDRFVFDQKGRGLVLGYWNERDIQRVIENLMTNAVKYGSLEPITITLDVADFSGDVQISVHNKGSYISPEIREQMFMPFFRSPGEDVRDQSWGVGLSIVRAKAEAHGGRIEVNSDSKTGTTFTVILPRDARPFTQQKDQT